MNEDCHSKPRDRFIAVTILLCSLAVASALLCLKPQRLDLHPDNPAFWLAWLEREDPSQRRTAVGVLSALEPMPEEVVSALMNAMGDQNPEVRFSAIAALHDQPQALDQIRAALHDPDPLVREIASAALQGCIQD